MESILLVVKSVALQGQLILVVALLGVLLMEGLYRSLRA